MIQNIKVDTIYYLTNSDFEMEFNLCGCCKMRLLTDKAENAKNFVGLLSRAVSRSQVIIYKCKQHQSSCETGNYSISIRQLHGVPKRNFSKSS